MEPVAPSVAEDHIPTTGVIFVHGIGSQKPGETLLQWSTPLIEVLIALSNLPSAGEDLAHRKLIVLRSDAGRRIDTPVSEPSAA